MQICKYENILFSCRKLGAFHLRDPNQESRWHSPPVALSQARQLTNPQAIPWKLRTNRDPFLSFPFEGVLGVGDILLILTHCRERKVGMEGEAINLPECLLNFFLGIVLFWDCCHLLSDFQMFSEIVSICSCLHGGMEAWVPILPSCWC